MIRPKVYVLPQALKQIDRLPGNVRQRVRRAVVELGHEPQSPGSKPLDFETSADQELWRLRLEDWRIVYLIDHEWDAVYVLAVRKRPPYQYEDLATLVSDLE
jgi:mRNA-degrading endonuclease RelE of RelBE toxin-antitoxin system